MDSIGYLSWNEVLTDNEDRLWVTNWRIGGPEYLQPVVADATLPNEISLPQRLLDCEIWKDDTCAPITAGSDGRFWGIGENGALLSGLYHDESWQETVLPGTRAEPQTGWVVADSSGKVWIALDGNPYTAEIVDGDIRVEVEEGNDVWAYAAGERTLWRIRANRLERRAAAGSWETITNAPETIQALTLRGDEPVLAWCGEDGVLRLAALSGEIARLEGLTPSRCVVTA